jgi:hypothetical protein
MDDLLGNLIWRSQNRTVLCRYGGSLQMVSELLYSLRWGEHAHADKGHQWALAGTPRIERSHKGRQQECWVLREGDCDVPHRLDRKMSMCLYVYSHSS